jgi:hypothetical protein
MTVARRGVATAIIGLGISEGEGASEIQVRELWKANQCDSDGSAQELRQVQQAQERKEKMTVYPLLGASFRGKTGH